MYFETNIPVMAVLYQTSGTTGGQFPANLYLPPIAQWSSEYNFYVPVDRTAYAGIAIDGYYLSDLEYNGNPASGLFTFKVGILVLEDTG